MRLPRATAKGGLSAAQALARSQRLWNIVKACFPALRDATQGFWTEVCVSSLVFGLLSGGKGFSATELMGRDDPLLRTLGQDAAPSAETIEEVIRYMENAGTGPASARWCAGAGAKRAKRSGTTRPRRRL